MLDSYTQNIRQIIKRLYIVGENIDACIKQFLTSPKSEKEILQDYIRFISSLEKMPDSGKAQSNNRKSQFITNNIREKPKTILDIGAGTADIAIELKNHYSLAKENVYVLDLQPIDTKEVSVIHYTPDVKIPLPNKSVYLVIMLSLLHHMEPNTRTALLNEVDRVLAANGQIVIREHDDQRNKLFRIYIQLVHYTWYIHNNEPYDPLHMMTKSELQKLFASYGWEPVPIKNNINASDPQKVYMQIFKRRVMR